MTKDDREAAASHRWETERLLQTETARVATQTISLLNARLHGIEDNVGAEFDERQRIYLHFFFSRISTDTSSAAQSLDS